MTSVDTYVRRRAWIWTGGGSACVPGNATVILRGALEVACDESCRGILLVYPLSHVS